MEDIYCVKCKNKTKNLSVKIVDNGRIRRASCRCEVCNSLKSRFLKKEDKSC